MLPPWNPPPPIPPVRMPPPPILAPPRKAGPPIPAKERPWGAAKLRPPKDCGAKLWRAGAHARLFMAVVFHVRLAKAEEFQAREPTPEEPFHVRVVTPGAFCPRATEVGAFPNRVVGEPAVGVDIRPGEPDMRLPGVVPVKFLLPVTRELFIANPDERAPVAMPSRLFTSVAGRVPRTEGGPAPWKFATLRLCAATLRSANDG